MLGYEKSPNRVNIFNLGLQEQTKVDELADIVIEEMGLSNVTKKYSGGDRGWIGDNPVVYLSIKKMQDLGWRPRMSPAETIRETAEMDFERDQRKENCGLGCSNVQSCHNRRSWIPRQPHRQTADDEGQRGGHN